jgi:hypothetical protein
MWVCHELANHFICKSWILDHEVVTHESFGHSVKARLVWWHGRLIFCKYPLKLCLFSFENLIPPPPHPHHSRKECALGIDLGSSNGVEASDLPVQIWLNGGSIYFSTSQRRRSLNGGSSYFQLARGGRLPPHPQEVEFRLVSLLAGAARGACSRGSSRGVSRPTIWEWWARRAGCDIGLGWGWDLGSTG